MFTKTHLAAGAAALAIAVSVATTAPAQQGQAANDNLNATVWMQRSVEYKAGTMAAYKLATLMLDAALADKDWTAALEQGENYQDKPPAVILDVDETVLDNSDYQAWMVRTGNGFRSKTWGAFVNTVGSRPIPGSLEFTKYAAAKGVKVFYVSNRNADLEEATRVNLAKYGYPVASDTDVVLLRKERSNWGSKKGNRRALVAEDYRILLLLGDNFGDFVDGYKQSPEERLKLMAAHQDKWGNQWIMFPNPTYGSWESAGYGFNYKLSNEDKRAAKLERVTSWPGQ